MTLLNGSLQMNGSLALRLGMTIRDLATGVGHFLLYKNTGDPNFYIRDTVNSRMLMTMTPGASSAVSTTTLHSQLNIDGHITSAFQSPSADPSTLDISSGMSRLVKNTTSGEIRHWVNDGGTMKKSAAYT